MRAHRTHQLATALALALATAACGGDTTSSSPPAPAPVATAGATTATESTTPAAPAASAAGSDASEATLGGQVCDMIRAVQADLGTDAPDGAYMAQLTLKLSSILVDQQALETFREKGDALARSECPSEYGAFLEQANIQTLNSL